MTVGISGPIGAGKSTYARNLAGILNSSPFGPVAVVESLAAPIKKFVESLGIRDKGDPRYRPACQLVGSAMRSIDPDVFVKRVPERQSITILDDVRYPNEAMACQFLIYLPGQPSPTDHESESHHRWLARNADIIALRGTEEMAALCLLTSASW